LQPVWERYRERFAVLQEVWQTYWNGFNIYNERHSRCGRTRSVSSSRVQAEGTETRSGRLGSFADPARGGMLHCNHDPTLQRLSTPSRVEQIANTPVTVKANRYYYYAFKVPPDAKGAIVRGYFSTAGGTGDEIEAYILNKDDFEDWWNGKQSQTLYHSGTVTRSTINAQLPAGDVYYLVLNNQVSQASSKVVQIDVTLTYNL